MALTTNLIAYYSFDADNANDSSGNGNNATATSGVTYGSTFGKINDGANSATNGTSQINLPSGVYSLSDGASPNYTIAGWTKPNGNFASGQNGTEAFSINVSGSVRIFADFREVSTAPNSKFHIGMRNSSGTVVETDASDTASTGVYHHWAVTYDGSTMIGYHNGSNVASITASIQNATATTGRFATAQSSSPITPSTDEVGFWTRALSSSEITQLYNGGSGLNPLTSGSTPKATLALMGVG